MKAKKVFNNLKVDQINHKILVIDHQMAARLQTRHQEM